MFDCSDSFLNIYDNGDPSNKSIAVMSTNKIFKNINFKEEKINSYK
jgi:hypothetical protein